MVIAATNQKPIRCEVNIIELSDLTSAECLTYNFRVYVCWVCILPCPKKTAAIYKSCGVLWLAPPVYKNQTHLRGKDFSSCPAKNWGRDYSHTTMARSSWSPISMEKKEYRNGGHWLPNKSELWSRPNTRSKWTNKFNTNEAIKVIKDGCKIQFLFHWMVQLSWLLLG